MGREQARDELELGRCSLVPDSRLNHELKWFVQFVALQTLLKRTAIPLNGVCRKSEIQLSGREQLALCCLAVVGRLAQGPLKFRETAKWCRKQLHDGDVISPPHTHSSFRLSSAVLLNFKSFQDVF